MNTWENLVSSLSSSFLPFSSSFWSASGAHFASILQKSAPSAPILPLFSGASGARFCLISSPILPQLAPDNPTQKKNYQDSYKSLTPPLKRTSSLTPPLVSDRDLEMLSTLRAKVWNAQICQIQWLWLKSEPPFNDFVRNLELRSMTLSEILFNDFAWFRSMTLSEILFNDFGWFRSMTLSEILFNDFDWFRSMTLSEILWMTLAERHSFQRYNS